MITFSDCERAYAKANAHWLACGICGPAGGEGADPKALCQIGRNLLNAWECREAAYGRREGYA